MSIDLSQFREVFFEESFEGLETMESHLLDLDANDVEALNAVFRAAHSIKGGAGMFNFTNVVEFTHVVETLLDELRSGKRDLSSELENLLLKSSDAIKDLLYLAQEDDPSIPSQVTEIQQQLNNLLTRAAGSDIQETAPAAEAPSAEPKPPETPLAEDSQPPEAPISNAGWQILFHPHEDMLQTGNEPLHMITALAELGDLQIHCNHQQIPDWESLEPEHCYLSWQIELYGDASRDDIEEVFAWVEDECDLEISELGVTSSTEMDTTDDLPAETIGEQVPAETAYAAMPEETETAEPEQSAPVTEPAVPTTSEAAPQSTQEYTETAAAETATEKSTSDRRHGDRRQQSDRRRSLDRRSGGETNSIRVSIDKIDTLINRVGELVITQSMLNQINSSVEELDQQNLDRFREGLIQLERNTREIQEDVMQIRMLPISFVFNRFPRLVHDLQTQLDKRIELVIKGESTELDKTLMEKISDPLVHLVRNSIDHGVEMPADRIAKGKPEAGRVELEAYHQGGNIIIEIRDDGKGLDTEKILQKGREKGLVGPDEIPDQQQIFELILQPGFSTAETVSDLSGRGVGMDVVSKNINELGGNIEISSETGKGSCFRISLPLTLAILDGQQVELGDQVYIIPLVSIIESLQVPANEINAIAGKDRLYSFRGDYIPLVSLRRVMGFPEDPDKENLIVVVEANNQLYGLIVDDLQGQQQFVIKSLEENYRKVEGVAGATILGNGRVGLILDVGGILRLNRQLNLQRNSGDPKVVQLRTG